MQKLNNLPFIVLEGGDGSGKSTLLLKLELYFKELGFPLLITREPGGTDVSQEIRETLLKPGRSLSAWTELFLYEAARAEHVEKVILPALREGKIVLCDRFTYSTLAYQGYGRGLPLDWVDRLNTLAIQSCAPNLVVWLKIDPLEAKQRILKRAPPQDRLEKESLQFHQNVFKGFEKIAEQNPDLFIKLDATEKPEVIFENLLQHPLWKKTFSSIKTELGKN